MTFLRVRVLLLVASALSLTDPARSASFGRLSANAVLGQTLQAVVPVKLDDGERLSAECVFVEIYAGDSRLPPGQVRVQILPSANGSDWVAQITTTSPVEEPILEINLLAGCDRRFTRRFTVLADPPLSVVPRSMSQPVPGDGAAESVPVAAPAMDTAALPARAVRKPRSVGTNAEAPHGAGVEAQARAGAAPHAPKSSKVPKPSSVAATSGVRSRESGRLVLEAGDGPLLRMDWEEPLLTGQVPPPDEAASSADARLQSLEGALDQFKRDGQAAQTRAQVLERQLADSNAAARLQPWLYAALAAALALAGGLFWKLRRQQKIAQEAAWWASSDGKPVTARADDEDAHSVMGPADWSGSGSDGLLVASGMEPPEDWELPHAAPAPQPASIAAASTAPLQDSPAGFGAGFNPLGTQPLEPLSSPTREVSVEELLDLEQQADFFIALGQEDAAVDLLMAYLRSTGGQSPLPYTKLLEIYRRQGDRSAYERIRARFNRRFNAYAPDWDVGPQVGRQLEDYPEAVEQMQAVWRTPLDAMATLEAMLFRRDESQDMFDLPAYKDVLLMYSIARDLWSQGDQAASEVDLLLPLGETGVSTFVGGQVLDLDLDADAPDAEFTRFELEHGLQPVVQPLPGQASPSGDEDSTR